MTEILVHLDVKFAYRTMMKRLSVEETRRSSANGVRAVRCNFVSHSLRLQGGSPSSTVASQKITQSFGLTCVVARAPLALEFSVLSDPGAFKHRFRPESATMDAETGIYESQR